MIAYLRRMKEILGAGLLALALGGCVERRAAASEPDCPPPSKTMVESIERTNDGVKAMNRRDYDAAIGKLGEATKLDPANHTAWYNLGLAHDALKRHDDAADAYEQAVRLEGKDAMYRLKRGIALYKGIVEAAVERERASRSDDAVIDPSALDLAGANFEPALQELETALALNADLFRAHFYIGRIRRFQGDHVGTAAAFTRAIELGPREVDPYIALGELYRRWEYVDLAIQVLAQGDLMAQGEVDERAELLFALGIAHFDKRDHASAVEHFTRALDTFKNIHKARFGRALAYAELGNLAKAKQDFELYLKVAQDDFTRTIASQQLIAMGAEEAP